MTNAPKANPQRVAVKSNTPAQAPSSGPSLVKQLQQKKKGLPMKTILIATIIVLVGIGTGYGLTLATSGGAGGIKSAAKVEEEGGVKVGDVIGSSEAGFKDKATGVLDRGGIDGEGSHHLLREGGPDQTAYLTSSVVDLELFVGHKVEVWGETFSAQKAGWFMDVGRVKVLELNAEKPFETEED